MKRMLSILLVLAMVLSLAVTAFADTWTCPECGEKNTGEFCGECGAHISATVGDERKIILKRSYNWFCLKCGTVSAKKFCTNCGEKRSEGLVGSFVTFGAYEQDNNISNGGEPIEWIVLEETKSSLALLSRYLLDVQSFDEHQSTKDWAGSSLRIWLNSTFESHAFSRNEKALLQPYEGDDVMLLYYGMTDRVLVQRESRSVTPTAYAKSKIVDWSYSTCWFINNGGSCGYVDGSGSSLGEMSSGGGTKNLYIRPMIRIRNVVDELNETAYQEALALQLAGQYTEAIAAFRKLDGYKDSEDRITACETAYKDQRYDAATALMESGDYNGAITVFRALKGYRDSTDQITACETTLKDQKYDAATALMESGDYNGAITAFRALKGYRDSAAQITACKTAIKERDYVAASKLMGEGKYSEAYTAFLVLRGYKDVDTLLATDENLKAAALATYDVGNIVTMGNYGGEAVEWLVLAAEGDTRTMITVKGQDAVCFNKSKSDGNKWETSYIHTWLNGAFYNKAFSTEEQAMITAGPTGDKVWLLSVDEVNKYFADNASRVCYPSAYAKKNGAYTSDSGADWWWLRSPGSGSDFAALVHGDGYVYSNGYSVSSSDVIARPVVVVTVRLLTKS